MITLQKTLSQTEGATDLLWKKYSYNLGYTSVTGQTVSDLSLCTYIPQMYY